MHMGTGPDSVSVDDTMFSGVLAVFRTGHGDDSLSLSGVTVDSGVMRLLGGRDNDTLDNDRTNDLGNGLVVKRFENV